jgi:hypothetical protein
MQEKAATERVVRLPFNLWENLEAICLALTSGDCKNLDGIIAIQIKRLKVFGKVLALVSKNPIFEHWKQFFRLIAIFQSGKRRHGVKAVMLRIKRAARVLENVLGMLSVGLQPTDRKPLTHIRRLPSQE